MIAPSGAINAGSRMLKSEITKSAESEPNDNGGKVMPKTVNK